MIRPFSRYIPGPFQLVPVLLIIAGFLQTGFYYDSLPSTIPTGLTAMGSVTGYAEKSLYRAYYLPLISIALFAALTAFAYFFLIRPSDPAKHLGLNPQLRKKISRKYLESYRKKSVQLIFAAATSLLAALIATNSAMLHIALDNSPGIFGYIPWVFYLGAVIFAIRYYFLGRQVKKTIREAIGI